MKLIIQIAALLVFCVVSGCQSGGIPKPRFSSSKAGSWIADTVLPGSSEIDKIAKILGSNVGQSVSVAAITPDGSERVFLSANGTRHRAGKVDCPFVKTRKPGSGARDGSPRFPIEYGKCRCLRDRHRRWPKCTSFCRAAA